MDGIWNVAPATALGILLALGSGQRRWRRAARSRLSIADRGLAKLVLARRGFVAITLGEMVVAVRPLTPAERRHESAHLDQFRDWGWRFIPAYLYHQWRRGYQDNPFEVAARAAEADGPDYLPEG